MMVSPAHHPLVSVILMSFNQRQHLREAIESVLNQTFDDYELILVDNGSTDGSAETMAEYAGHGNVRIFAFPSNEPITQRSNAAIEAASGEFVSFLFSDDFYLPQKLRRQVDHFARLTDDYGVVYGPGLRHNELTGARWCSPSIRASGFVFRNLMTEHGRGPIQMITAMIRRDCLLQHRFHEDLFTEGEAIFFRLALTHRFAFSEEPLAVMRDHDKNMGKALIPNLANSRVGLEKLRREPAMNRELAPFVDRYEGNLLRSSGWQGARLNVDPRWVRSSFGSAIRFSWRHALHPKTWIGIVLTALPTRPRRFVNGLAGLIRRSPTNDLLVHEYGRPSSALDTFQMLAPPGDRSPDAGREVDRG